METIIFGVLLFIITFAIVYKYANNYVNERSLRAKCVKAYGEEFGEMYDALNRGETIGGFEETIVFLEMLEAVKKGTPYVAGDNEKLKENISKNIKISEV